MIEAGEAPRFNDSIASRYRFFCTPHDDREIPHSTILRKLRIVSIPMTSLFNKHTCNNLII
jgi:hypothetical protein